MTEHRRRKKLPNEDSLDPTECTMGGIIFANSPSARAALQLSHDVPGLPIPQKQHFRLQKEGVGRKVTVS